MDLALMTLMRSERKKVHITWMDQQDSILRNRIFKKIDLESIQPSAL